MCRTPRSNPPSINDIINWHNLIYRYGRYKYRPINDETFKFKANPILYSYIHIILPSVLLNTPASYVVLQHSHIYPRFHIQFQLYITPLPTRRRIIALYHGRLALFSPRSRVPKIFVQLINFGLYLYIFGAVNSHFLFTLAATRHTSSTHISAHPRSIHLHFPAEHFYNPLHCHRPEGALYIYLPTQPFIRPYL